MKGNIKKRSIRYSKQMNFMRKSKMDALKGALEKEADKIEKNPEHGKERFFQIKTEIDEYEKEGAKVKVEYSMQWMEKDVQNSF